VIGVMGVLRGGRRWCVRGGWLFWGFAMIWAWIESEDVRLREYISRGFSIENRLSSTVVVDTSMVF
jgi:hypothetical protein